MLGNAVLKAIVTIENLVIGNVTTVTTRVVSVTVAGAQFTQGDLVLAQCRDATGFTARLSFYGVVVDATHIGLCIPNASAADVDPADTFDWTFYVFSQTGAKIVGT
jgi:hypothetical protein